MSGLQAADGVAPPVGGETDHPPGMGRRLLIAAVALPPTVVLGYGLWAERLTFRDASVQGLPIIPLLAISFFMAFIPPAICMVQNVTRSRQLRRLTSLEAFPVSKTAYFRAALTSVDKVRTVSVDGDYLAPITIYAAVLLIGFVTLSLGLALPWILDTPYVLLTGWKQAGAVVTANGPAPAGLRLYQAQTFAVAAMAFVGSYVYAITRLLDRVNNNDLYPISLSYLTARVPVAMFVSIIIRHSSDAFGLEGQLLLLVGFVIGLAPDQFIVAMSRRAFQAMKIWGVRRDPHPSPRPTALSLLLIDDLSRDKIDRLQELGIDSAQVLARQNPFLLWPRLPYDLGLIVDWIGQAQLYCLVRDDKLMALRASYVRDACDLEARLADGNTHAGICRILGIEAQDAAAIVAQLAADPSYVRLKQVRVALTQLG